MISKKISVLGVQIDQKNHQECVEKVIEFLNTDSQHSIFTPNPEMLVMAASESYFREVLNSADLLLCDGKGVEFVTQKKLHRLSGVDFIEDICRVAAQENKKVFLLGTGSSEVLEKAKFELEDRHLGLEIVGMHEGVTLKMSEQGVEVQDRDTHKKMLETIQKADPEILFVAFGHGKQEMWIDEYLSKLPSVQIAMGVGGSFEFIAKKLPRAPKWMRSIGLEWLFRLMLQPKRIKRIWNAVVVFPVLYFFNRKQN